MSSKYVCCLILCVTLLQEIFSWSDEDIRQQSSHRLFRTKRLIDKTPNGNHPAKIQDVPYIVNIQRNNVNQCGGSILSHKMIITAGHCFREQLDKYTVLSNTTNLHKGIRHKIVKKFVHPDFHLPNFPNDLALVEISPVLDLVKSLNRMIPLHNGILPKNSHGTFSGWGCIVFTDEKVEFPIELRSINVPLISQKECQDAYPRNVITTKEVCTLDKSGNKSSCNGDSGGPLVVDGKLLGVMSWGGISGNGEDPDVYLNLAYPPYTKWISSHVKK